MERPIGDPTMHMVRREALDIGDLAEFGHLAQIGGRQVDEELRALEDLPRQRLGNPHALARPRRRRIKEFEVPGVFVH